MNKSRFSKNEETLTYEKKLVTVLLCAYRDGAFYVTKIALYTLRLAF